jgi:hypothetical protein
MIADPLDRLRANDPLPAGSTAPPVDEMLRRIRAGRTRRRPTLSLLVPVLGTAAALAVATVALVLAGHHTAHRAGPNRQIAPAAPVTAPRGGMLGLVYLQGFAFGTGSDGVISLQQCLGCHRGDPGRHSVDHEYEARTDDGGRSWHVSRRSYYVVDPRFEGADGWAEGIQAQSTGGGYVHFYVTHDAGRTWRIAGDAAGGLGGQPVSVGGGEVWATGGVCTRSGCGVTVQHAPIGGERLTATAAQPITGGWTNVHAVAAGPGTAYVVNPDEYGDNFVTHDDGRSWRRIAPPCRRAARPGLTVSVAAGILWDTCEALRGGRITVVRSADGGARWEVTPGHFTHELQLQAVSATVAWGLTERGVVRTSNGGRMWTTVWSPRTPPRVLQDHAPYIAALGSFTPILDARSADDASVLTIVTRGRVDGQARSTNLVVSTTRDGGASWQAHAIGLPAR